MIITFNRILIENPHIYQLYNDLVVAQIVSAEDFWKNFVNVTFYMIFLNPKLFG